MTSRFLSRAALPTALVVLLAVNLLLRGCGDPRLYPVEGVVHLDGAPLKGASVIFIPQGPGQPVYGVTRLDGRFYMDTNIGTGARAATYKVLLDKISGPPLQGIPPWIGGRVTEAQKAAWFRKEEELRRQQKQWVPKRYLNTATTPLQFTVPVKEKLRLELSSSETPAGDGS